MQKKILLLLFTFVFGSHLSNAQGFSKEIPNYIFAGKANFVVNVISMIDTSPKETYTASWSSNSTTTKIISPNDYPNLDEGLFNALTLIIQKEFEKINLHPEMFVNISLQEATNSETMKKYNEVYAKVNPYFVINIVNTSDWKKTRKAFEQNRLDANDIKPISISISLNGETDPKKTFALAKMNMSLIEAIDELGKKILEKPSGYFVTDIEKKALASPKDVDSTNAIIDKTLKENAILPTFPDENELKNNELLFLYEGPKEGFFYNAFKKTIDRYYPYKYRIVDKAEYDECLSKSFRYGLVYKTFLAERTKYSEGTRTSTTVMLMYYVIKNYDTYDLYYGEPISKVMNKGNSYFLTALKITLKRMQKYYGWVEKEK